MKLKAKTILLVLAFAIPALLMCILVINKAKHLPIVSPEGPIQTPPHGHPGKEKLLATLKNESLDVSIRGLLDDSDRVQYYFPFIPHSGVDVQDEIEELLANRRLLKVAQQIKSLSKSEGQAKCERLFISAFQQQTNACRIIINWSLNPSAPAHHQYLLCSQMSLAAAMFIAAETTNLDLLNKQFERLDKWRIEIEPSARLQNRRMTNYPALFSSEITPDYRLQVNVLRLAALRLGNAETLEKVDEACQAIHMTTNTLPIVSWDAKTTVFELLPDSRLDTNKGVTTYTFYDWSDKMKLDHARYRDQINSNDSPPADEEKMFVKKLESIVFH